MPAVDVTPLPKGPEIVRGIINLRGTIVPVLDVRKRLRLPERQIELRDHFIVARTPKRTVAMPVDAAQGVVGVPDLEITEAKDIVAGLEYVEGVARLKDGMLLIHDLKTFLSLEEEDRLENAIKEQE